MSQATQNDLHPEHAPEKRVGRPLNVLASQAMVPSESDLIKAIQKVFNKNTNSFASMDLARLVRRVRHLEPGWLWSEGRLKDIRARAVKKHKLKPSDELDEGQVKWDRFENFDSESYFLIDAAPTADVLKLLSR